MRLRLWWLCALCGCASASGAAVNAAINSAVALSVGAGNVASGNCFTSCPVGTTCNLKTKMCEDLPCHGSCDSLEVCDQSGLIDHCVPMQRPVPLRVDETPK
jgi:hypothetical protein